MSDDPYAEMYERVQEVLGGDAPAAGVGLLVLLKSEGWQIAKLRKSEGYVANGMYINGSLEIEEEL